MYWIDLCTFSIAILLSFCAQYYYRNNCSSNRRWRAVHYRSWLSSHHYGHWCGLSLRRHSGRHKRWLTSHSSSHHWLASWRLSDGSHESIDEVKLESVKLRRNCVDMYTVCVYVYSACVHDCVRVRIRLLIESSSMLKTILIFKLVKSLRRLFRYGGTL